MTATTEPGSHKADPDTTKTGLQKLAKGEWVAIGLALVPAAAGAILSFGAMYKASVPWFDPDWHAALVPIAVDGAIFGGAVGWIMARHAGSRGTPWRFVAHLGVILTVWINYLAVPSDVPENRVLGIGVHIGGPIIWSVFVEIIAHHIAKRRRAKLGEEIDRIPWRLWLTRPADSFRTWRRMAITGQSSAVLAGFDADRCEAAIERLRLAITDKKHKGQLRIITRRLVAGSLPPQLVLDAIDRADRGTGKGKADTLLSECMDAVLQVKPDRPDRPELPPPSRPRLELETGPAAPKQETATAPAGKPARPDGSPDPDNLTDDWIAWAADMLADWETANGRKISQSGAATLLGVHKTKAAALVAAVRDRKGERPPLAAVR